jgi:hypothetical protein
MERERASLALATMRSSETQMFDRLMRGNRDSISVLKRHPKAWRRKAHGDRATARLPSSRGRSGGFE